MQIAQLSRVRPERPSSRLSRRPDVRTPEDKRYQKITIIMNGRSHVGRSFLSCKCKKVALSSAKTKTIKVSECLVNNRQCYVIIVARTSSQRRSAWLPFISLSLIILVVVVVAFELNFKFDADFVARLVGSTRRGNGAHVASAQLSFFANFAPRPRCAITRSPGARCHHTSGRNYVSLSLSSDFLEIVAHERR